MRILIIGAGVTGSLFASYLINNQAKLEKRFKEQIEINLLARGDTYNHIHNHGLKINHVVQKIVTIDKIPVIKKLESGDAYDYVLIFLRKTQIKDLLPLLSHNKSDYFIFFGNNGTGVEEFEKTIPLKKLALGFASVGGRREENTVFSVHGKKPTLSFGAVNPDRKKRMNRLSKVFRICGITSKKVKDMDSWLKYHLALVMPLAKALYKDGGDNYTLADNSELLKVSVKAIRESINALKSLKYPVRPVKLRFMMLLPDSLMRGKIKKLLSSDLGRLVVYDHCMAAPEEMKALFLQLDGIVQNGEAPLDNLKSLD